MTQQLNIEKVKEILEARYTHNKKGEIMKRNAKNPLISDAAYQTTGVIRRLYKKYPNIDCMWNLKKEIDDIMTIEDNVNTRCTILSSLSILCQKINKEEIEVYFGSPEKYQSAVEHLKKLQTAVMKEKNKDNPDWV